MPNCLSILFCLDRFFLPISPESLNRCMGIDPWDRHQKQQRDLFNAKEKACRERNHGRAYQRMHLSEKGAIVFQGRKGYLDKHGHPEFEGLLFCDVTLTGRECFFDFSNDILDRVGSYLRHRGRRDFKIFVEKDPRSIDFRHDRLIIQFDGSDHLAEVITKLNV